MSSAPVIVWFRDDLRLADHPALASAATTGTPLLCLYVLEEGEPGLRPLGGAARWWLAGSLRALDAGLERLGQRLVLRRGAAAAVVPAVAAEIGAQAVYWNRRHTPAGAAIDARVEAELAGRGIAVRAFPGDLLDEPESLRSAAHAPPRLFAPFWRRLQQAGAPRAPLPAPRRASACITVKGDRLEDWNLEPSAPNWAAGLREKWTRGEAGAAERLRVMVDANLRDYVTRRERADLDGTSRLSPHLRFGEVSPAQVWHAAQLTLEAPAKERPHAADVEKFLAELGWREFSRHQLRAFPALATSNMRAAFDRFPWRDDDAALTAWQRGRTGYPLVDAAMRDLWASGWMPNRLRMLVASFLVKHLLIDWRRGEAWFWDTLVDADAGSNPANWQWAAGTGIDSAPYFRIFNPTLQGERADPTGDYVRRWIPELARLPTKHIHAPWTAPPLLLVEASVKLGVTYPHPIVDHAFARQRALAAFAQIKAQA